MKLRYYLPRADLRDLVRAYYLFETDAFARQPLCAELGNIRFTLNGAGRLLFEGGAVAPFSPATIIGPTMSAYAMEAAPMTRVFGAGVLPRGWALLFGVPAEDLADRMEDLVSIAGPGAARIAEEMQNTDDDLLLVDAADRFFAYLRDRNGSKLERAFPVALQDWLLDPEDLVLDRLVERMDVSRRQTDRLSKQFFGASPKLLQRKYRALRAADRLLFGGAEGWLDAAGESFYDQSHFIKEFKTFLGATPAGYARDNAGLIAQARSGRRDRRVRHPLAGL